MSKTRAERSIGRGKTPTQRAKRGARTLGRQDPEAGVTSRARKTKRGSETVPDPRYGARPGSARGKWRTPAERTSPRQKKRTAAKRSARPPR